HRVK
ncbi:hypothetical protein D049_1364B, partial [Vibrio parahaemolyticus VPTS-2010]